MTTEALPISGLVKLRAPFPDHQISKLPKESKAQADERKNNRSAGVSCRICGGWHHKNAVHLDYVGHAALTDRLLDADPYWSWEPAAIDASGLPVYDREGGMWIRLTVCGVTRLGYGHAGEKRGGDAIKEIIGDALRNAAMRFGAALDLWHKGDLHAQDDAGTEAADDRKPQPVSDESQEAQEAKASAFAVAIRDAQDSVALDNVSRDLAGAGLPSDLMASLRAIGSKRRAELAKVAA